MPGPYSEPPPDFQGDTERGPTSEDDERFARMCQEAKQHAINQLKDTDMALTTDGKIRGLIVDGEYEEARELIEEHAVSGRWHTAARQLCNFLLDRLKQSEQDDHAAHVD